MILFLLLSRYSKITSIDSSPIFFANRFLLVSRVDVYDFFLSNFFFFNKSSNNFSRLYCYGFGTSFFVYVAVNMSMVLGLLPIVGAPLPIMSYGGSSMLSMMIALGIVMSTRIYSREIIN